MGCNTSKRTIGVWNDSTARLQDFDVNKSRSKALMEDFDNIYQNSHRDRSPKRGLLPHIDLGVQRDRTKLLNLPDELAGISEPNPFPRFPTKSNEQYNHKLPPRQESSYAPSRNREIRQAHDSVVAEPRSRHRENLKRTPRPILKPDKRSHDHHHPVPTRARVQQRPIRDSRSRPPAKTPERPSHRSRDLGRPTQQQQGRERDQVKKPSAEKYYRVSPRERRSSRPHPTQRISHGDTLPQLSSKPHHRKIEAYDQSPPKRVDRKPSASQLRNYPKNPYTEPRASYYYPRAGVLNIYV